jgi:hypothetical protein
MDLETEKPGQANRLPGGIRHLVFRTIRLRNVDVNGFIATIGRLLQLFSHVIVEASILCIKFCAYAQICARILR